MSIQPRTKGPEHVNTAYRSVIVGIDGSQAAIRAAEWAIHEAVSREAELRLIHVIHEQVEPATIVSVDNERMELEYGETALSMASAAVATTGKPVKVETGATPHRHLSPNPATPTWSASAQWASHASRGR